MHHRMRLHNLKHTAIEIKSRWELLLCPQESQALLSPNFSEYQSLKDGMPPPNHYPRPLVQSVHRGPVPPVAFSDIICILGRSEVLVSCRAPSNSKEQLGMVSPLLVDTILPPSILAAYSACQVQVRNLPERIMITNNCCMY